MVLGGTHTGKRQTVAVSITGPRRGVQWAGRACCPPTLEEGAEKVLQVRCVAIWVLQECANVTVWKGQEEL